MTKTEKNLTEQLNSSLQSTFDRIKSGLPSAYAELLQTNVRIKTGRKFSLSYIKQVVRGERNSTDILECAIELINERNRRTNTALLNALYAENGNAIQTINNQQYELTGAGWQALITTTP